MSKYQPIIDAINADDLRLAKRLIEIELAPKGSRGFDDVDGAIQSALASGGEQCPRLAIRHPSELRRAVIGCGDFMKMFRIRLTSNNRNLLVKLVSKHVLAFIRTPPEGEDADKYFKRPPWLRVMDILASPSRIAAVIGVQFPDYLDSGLVSFIGFTLDVD